MFFLGAHGESFYTPPVSPQSDVPALRPLHPASPQPSSAPPVTSPPPIPPTREKKAPAPPSLHCDWKPHPPLSPSSFSGDPTITLVHSKVKGQTVFGRNGVPPTSTPRDEDSQEKPLTVSPSKSPPTPPVQGSSSRQSGTEWDSGLSQSLLPDSGELEKLLEECRATLGLTTGQDVALNAAGKSQTSVTINEHRISPLPDFYYTASKTCCLYSVVLRCLPRDAAAAPDGGEVSEDESAGEGIPLHVCQCARIRRNRDCCSKQRRGLHSRLWFCNL